MRARPVFILLALAAVAGCQTNHLPQTCSLKPVSGKCRAALMRWYYEENENACKGFIWGGCEGVVPFETRADCFAQCLPGQTMPIEDPDARNTPAVPLAPAAVPAQSPCPQSPANVTPASAATP